MSRHTHPKSTPDDHTTFRPRLSDEEKRANSRKAGIKYYHSNPHVKERKRLRMAQMRAEKKMARRVSGLKAPMGEHWGRYKMNRNGSAAHNWGTLGHGEVTPGDREMVASYVLSNFCGPQGRKEAQDAWFPTRKGETTIPPADVRFRGLQFAYDNGFCVHAQLLVDALTEMGVEVPQTDRLRRHIAANEECAADLFPRAPSPFPLDEKPPMEPVMEFALERGLAIPPHAITPKIRVWARANGYPVPSSLGAWTAEDGEADTPEGSDRGEYDELEDDELENSSDVEGQMGE
ncbi:hypothetical protein C8J57DRAFT_1499315 [Mycena rebaudengoi]|nr:hypothetical protein C8J57DRAFT_1499315 [Mycena rebaudengoi]